jgi:hypothetical protein
MQRKSSFDDDNFETIVGQDGKSARVLRDKGRLRVSMSARDRDSLTPLQKAIAADTAARTGNRITDGYGNRGLNLQRPGFRLQQAHDTRQQQIVEDSYRAYDKRMTYAHRLHDGETLCPACAGEGIINGETCDRCSGDGVVDDNFGDSKLGSSNDTGSNDSRTKADDRAKAYESYDRDLQNAFRNGG